MSTSYIDIKELGRVKLFRRKGLKNIRISVNSVGEVRLSIPWYVPKTAGIRYLRTKKDWVKKHQKVNNLEWRDEQQLINGYKLKIHTYQRKKVSVSLDGEFLRIYIPEWQSDDRKQQSINRQVDKFLKAEAEKTLIPLTMSLADKEGYRPKSVKIKKLKSRWGSCNHNKAITLNLSLLRLADELIEYVILHELVHTNHLNHSKRFWQEVEAILPDYKARRKKLKAVNIAGVF